MSVICIMVLMSEGTPQAPQFSVDSMRPLEIKNALPMFVIPKDVRQELITGSKPIIDLIKDPATKPDLIFVLERSAPSAFAATTTLAKTAGVDLPPTLNVHIGREIGNKFTDEFGSKEEERGIDIYEDGPDVLKRYREEYRRWMESNPYVQRLVQNIRTQMQGIAEIKDIRRILVVDDVSYEGATKDHTVPLLMERLFADLTDRPPYVFAQMLKNSDWHTRILNETFGAALPTDITYAMTELMTGYREDESSADGSGLAKITSEGQVLEILDEARDHFPFIQSSNPGQLKDKFGVSTLCALREGLTASVEESVK